MRNRPLPLLWGGTFLFQAQEPTEPNKPQTTGRLAAQTEQGHREGMQLFWAPRFCGGIQPEQRRRCFLCNYSP